MEIKPRKLVHSGIKKAYPSKFVWDCPNCNDWNIWQTSILRGKVEVICRCGESHTLNKSLPLVELTRTKDMKSIID